MFFNLKIVSWNNQSPPIRRNKYWWDIIEPLCGNAIFCHIYKHDFRPIRARPIFLNHHILWCKYFTQLVADVENSTREAQKKTVSTISEKEDILQSTNAGPVDELTTKPDALFWAKWFSDKCATVNTQGYGCWRAFFTVSWCLKEKTSQQSWGFKSCF